MARSNPSMVVTLTQLDRRITVVPAHFSCMLCILLHLWVQADSLNITTQIRSFGMTDRAGTFREGATAFRNAQDWRRSKGTDSSHMRTRRLLDSCSKQRTTTMKSKRRTMTMKVKKKTMKT